MQMSLVKITGESRVESWVNIETLEASRSVEKGCPLPTGVGSEEKTVPLPITIFDFFS